MKISIVIPAYNEAENLCDTIQEIRHILDQLSTNNIQYEILIVDDHSSDSTYSVVEQMKIPDVNIVRLSRRSGSHMAIKAGISLAGGDAVICISADGQDNPEILPDMVKKWIAGSQIVWAVRKKRSGEPFFIRLFTRIFYFLILLFREYKYIHVDVSRADFFLLDRMVVSAINSCKERNTSLFGLLLWLGFSQCFVEYERRPRRYGQSKWNYRSRFRLAKDWIIAFSGLPLKVMMLVGLFFAFTGFSYGLYIVYTVYTGNSLQGWPSIMVSILILSGIQMMMLGMIGEYLWRSLEESRDRPQFFIEKATVFEKKESSRT